MKSRMKQFVFQTAAALLLSLAISFTSLAATARIAFSDPTGEVGNEVSVTMKFTCTSGEALSSTNVMLAYDASALEFVGGSDNASGGSGAIRVTSGMQGTSEVVTTLKFKALKAGTTKVSVTSWEGYDEAGEMVTMEREGSSAITISGGASNAEVSTDASLQSLQISPGTLTPAFDPQIDSYTASVGLDVERLTVSAVAASNAASVSVEGGEQLQEGDNTVVCSVTAQDGTTIKTYTITVRKEEGGESQLPTETAAAPMETLAQLEASRNLMSISVTALPDGVEPPAGLKESSITIGDTKVTGWTPVTEGAPEYCVFYGISEGGAAGFYRYDMQDKTIQRYFADISTQIQTTPEYLEVAERYNSLVDSYRLMQIVAAVAGVAVVILIVVLAVAVRAGGRGKKEPKRGEPRRQRDHHQEARPEQAPSREERYMMGEEEETEEDEPEPDDDFEFVLVDEADSERAEAEAAVSGEEADDFEVLDLDED